MKNLFVLGIFSLALCLFCSCDSDKNEPSSGNHGASKGEWYTSGFTTSSDFKEINQAIDDHELLYSSKYGGDQYAESWAFFADHPDGSYSTVKPHWGRLRFIPTIQHASVYHIVDDTTIEDYLLFMYPIEANVGPTFRIVDAGNLGKLSWTTADAPTLYTYVKYDGKYILDNGTILIKRGDKLVTSGSSSSYTRFIPDF